MSATTLLVNKTVIKIEYNVICTLCTVALLAEFMVTKVHIESIPQQGIGDATAYW